MKTRLLCLISTLILGTYVLRPGHGLGAGQQLEQPTESATPAIGTTARVSVASDGTEGNDWSHNPSISADGRFVAFHSAAINLVSDDTNSYWDIFVHDGQTGETTRVSVASDGIQGDSSSAYPTISADGRYVAFDSYADNLVSGDTNSTGDVFVHDRQTGQTMIVSIASDGSQGNSSSEFSSISADGRYVSFHTDADNLVSGDTNDSDDVFVHDRQTGTTTRISVASDGGQGDHSSWSASISGNGFFVAFVSDATNLVNGDTNGESDIFVHDRQTGETTLVSVASDGIQENRSSRYPSISVDGRYLAFDSEADNLVSGDTNSALDVFVHDRLTGETTRVSVASDGTQGNSSSSYPSISADGRFVAFESWADNLVNGDTNGTGDVFVHDRLTGLTERVSFTSGGIQVNFNSWSPSITSNGGSVAFASYAPNLVPNDTNNVTDIFVHERGMDGTTEVFLPIIQ